MGLRFFLLNTRILLEALLDSDQLPVVIQIELMNPTNTIGFSVASIWEIVIKSALGREDFSSTQ
jgi:PIN domain nuclease of toxin-antitoxin system